MGLFARMFGVGHVLFVGRRDGDVTEGCGRDKKDNHFPCFHYGLSVILSKNI